MKIERTLTLLNLATLSVLAACNPAERLTRPRPAVPLYNSVPSEPFFVAWTEGSFVTSPIQTIVSGTLNPSQYREHWSSFTTNSTLLSFAAANPGRLYIHGDEPDQQCIAPRDYAISYHDFVASVLTADSTAKFSPAGFAEPNVYCCPPDPSPCHDQMHSIGYAEQFDSAYVALYGSPPRVDEWRFHDFGNDWGDSPHSQTYDVVAWENRVNGEATWAINHGAHMYLGSWSFMAWVGSLSPDQILGKIDSAITWVRSNPLIVGAAWWSYENTGYAHYLKNPDGTLTPEGQLYQSGPVSMALSGPYNVKSHGTCSWSVFASGGAAPFHYAWLVNNSLRSSASTLTYTNAGSPFRLSVTATDKYGVSVTSAETITISQFAPC